MMSALLIPKQMKFISENQKKPLTRSRLKQEIDWLLACKPDDFEEFAEALLDRVFPEAK